MTIAELLALIVGGFLVDHHILSVAKQALQCSAKNVQIYFFGIHNYARLIEADDLSDLQENQH